jgi:hypothetical protein
MSSNLEKVQQLNGVSWEWNENANKDLGLKGQQSGIIAQEVEKVLPDAIGKIKDYKSVNYMKVVGLLVEAVKELKNEVDLLKKNKI